MPYAQIARKYAKQIDRYDAQRYVSEHAKHIGKRPANERPPEPGTVGAMKEERHRQAVEDCIYDIYEKCKSLSEKAEKKAETSRDFQAAASCFDPGIRALALASKLTSNDLNETEPDGYIEAIRATAKNDWKEARAVQMATTKPKTEDGS